MEELMNLIQRVLVVEDEADSRDLMTRLFKFHNIRVVAAATAEEALQQLTQFSPNLIIVDLALPGMDGWTLLKRLKTNPSLSHTPIVAITAFHTAELAQEAIHAGFNAYFAKPLNVLTIINELEGLLRI
jgi:CheY-like chemotaxis protein